MQFDRGHAKDVPLLDDRFFGVVLFLSYRHQSSPKLPKNQFLEKSDPLTEKCQNFAPKGFTGTRIHVFLPSFAEIGKAEV